MNRWTLFVQRELRMSIRYISTYCEDDKSIFFFWSDPTFSTRISVRRGLTRTCLSLCITTDCARHFNTDISQNLSRLIWPNCRRNSLMKRSVVQEIPHLVWNPKVYHHVHKTQRSLRLCLTLRNTHTERSIALSAPKLEDHTLWNVLG
jgi:hypothetical protein